MSADGYVDGFYRDESPERSLATRPELMRIDSLGVKVIPETTKVPTDLRKDSFIADNTKKRQTRDDKLWHKRTLFLCLSR